MRDACMFECENKINVCACNYVYTYMHAHMCVYENDNCQNTIMTTFATKIFLSLEVFLTTSSRKDIQHFKIYFFFCKGVGLVWMYTW